MQELQLNLVVQYGAKFSKILCMLKAGRGKDVLLRGLDDQDILLDELLTFTWKKKEWLSGSLTHTFELELSPNVLVWFGAETGNRETTDISNYKEDMGWM